MPYLGFALTESALDFLAGLPAKLRRQVIKKAKALHANPFPATAKKLHNVETPDGEAVYRERSGDYRTLYVVRTKPDEVLILDIDNRKDVYRMPKTNPAPADELRMKEDKFDDMMKSALGAPPPPEKPSDGSADGPKRLSSFPAKRRKG